MHIKLSILLFVLHNSHIEIQPSPHILRFVDNFHLILGAPVPPGQLTLLCLVVEIHLGNLQHADIKLMERKMLAILTIVTQLTRTGL